MHLERDDSREALLRQGGSTSPLFLRLSSGMIPLEYVRHRRARRYILCVTSEGVARITLPRWGSKSEALSFAERHIGWMEKQIEKNRARGLAAGPWGDGTTILFRGENTTIQVDHEQRVVCFGDQVLPDGHHTGSLKDRIEAALRKIAIEELVPRTFALAAQHQLTVQRVVVRNQRTRWGSCSVRGTICLNWRLIQTPPLVSDYIIVHELMHLRQMNHSARFWKNVAQAFPEYRVAERWLRQNSAQLR